jgi:hypothetical protein
MKVIITLEKQYEIDLNAKHEKDLRDAIFEKLEEDYSGEELEAAKEDPICIHDAIVDLLDGDVDVVIPDLLIDRDCLDVKVKD